MFVFLFDSEFMFWELYRILDEIVLLWGEDGVFIVLVGNKKDLYMWEVGGE